MPISGAIRTSGTSDTSHCAKTFPSTTEVQRLRRQQHLFQRSILIVVREQAAERQHRRQQRGHPNDARRYRSQQLCLGSNPQWEEADDNDKEKERRQNIGAPPPCQRKIARATIQRNIERVEGALTSAITAALRRRGHWARVRAAETNLWRCGVPGALRQLPSHPCSNVHR